MNILNWKLTGHIIGMLVMLEAVFLSVSTLVALRYNVWGEDHDLIAMLVTTGVCAVIGGMLLLSNRRYNNSKFSYREGFFIVTVTWLLFSVIGMLPYLIYGTFTSVTDAFIETVSGFTTTGCTVMNDIDTQPHGILLWRSMTQWIGGLGIIVFSLALLPRFTTGNTQMFSAEVTGMSIDKLRPRIQDTSMTLWTIYVALTLVCAFLFWCGGMNLFDAFNHAMTTLSSGGFSTHQSSLGFYHSAFIEYVCCIFLFITSVNFTLFYFLRKKLWRPVWHNDELRWFFYIVVGFTMLFILLFVCAGWHAGADYDPYDAAPQGVEETFRTSLFHVLTIISTCGFQGEHYDYDLWGRMFWLPTLLMMMCGGCAGSTAGGIKVVRVVILLKNLMQELLQHLSPRKLLAIRLNNAIIPQEHSHRVMAFMFTYVVLAVICVFVMQVMGFDTDTAIGTTITSFGNCGPGLSLTGPAFTWSDLPDAAKWMMSFAMLMGRLEFFTVILLLTPSFWKK